MARARTKNKYRTKPKIKSNGKVTKVPGYGQSNKMAATFRKLEKAASLENEIIPLNDTVENVKAIIEVEITTQSKYK